MKKKSLDLVKNDFPIFGNNPNLVYLDSSATSLKPKIVIDKVLEYYQSYSANVFRGLYSISEKATLEYELSRKKVAKFINAKSPTEVIFVRGATEGINLVCSSLPVELFEKKEIAVTIAEHHANFVPWQALAQKLNIDFKVINVDENGVIPLQTQEETRQIITEKTKVLALHYVSNVLGIINPLKKIIKNIRAVNSEVIIVVDAAQAVPSLKIDVQDLDCDFLSFSGHKMLGPTGIGVLWGRKKLLDKMEPYQFGGEMISKVTISDTSYKGLPHKFEAGTPNIAGVIGLGAAVDYLAQFNFEDIQKHEQKLWNYCYSHLSQNKQIKIISPNKALNRVGIFTFTHQKIHSHDLSQLLSNQNICVRAGHHCAMPLHHFLKTDSTIRLSFYIYNTEEDIDLFIEALNKAEKILL